MLTNKDFYYCYNANKTAFLLARGFRFITRAITFDTSKEFWMFEKSEELKDALNEYSDFFNNK